MSERLWRTVTAMALPLEAARRRIEPERVRERIEQKDGPERAEEERRAAAAVRQALRHAGVRGDVETIRVQREPFEAKGARAEVFAAPPRFIKERLWHAEIAFVEAFPGPLVLGDGRYLGLGLMAPTKAKFRDTAVFVVPPEAHIAVADRPAFLRAVRRAEMALARRGDGSVATLFSGHEQDGAKANSGRHRHVFLAAADLDRDGYLDILVAAAPWACDHSAPYERSEDADFDRVVSHLSVVRAGRLGVVTLGSPQKMEGQSALIDPSRIWESATPCHPTRHARRNEDKAAACARDVIAECVRRGFPRPEVEVLEFVAAPNSGNCAFQLRLRFAVAVEGPILIGRDSHAGGGLFEATSL